MMKQNKIFLALLYILAIAVLVTPVAAAGLTISDGDKIITQEGFTSPSITIDDTAIPADYAITIDITQLHKYVADFFTFTYDNVVIDDEAVNAGWTFEVADNTLILYPPADATVPETITVTFTGLIFPWVPDTSVISGGMPVPLTVTRTDTGETATINFNIEIVPVPSPTAGLKITNGDWITSPNGATTPKITIVGSEILDGGIITIDMVPIEAFFAGWTVMDDNIVITSDAGATWSGTIDGGTLTLTSTGGNTLPDDTIDVTFRGTTDNPWIAYSEGHLPSLLTVTRNDGFFDPATITIVLDTVPPPPTGLSITNGEPITTTTGATSVEIEITDNTIDKDGSITLIVPFAPGLTASSPFSDANVLISDTADNADWTRTVSGGRVILTSTNGDTIAGEKVTVTFTGATNPWMVSIPVGKKFSYIPAVRSDGKGTGYFTFEISTQDPIPLIIGEGTKINTTNGNTSMVITITGEKIVPEGTIIVDLYYLQPYVAIGPITDDNVFISDTADNATWTREMTGDWLILKSAGGSTIAGETVNVTFTGATNHWKPYSGGEVTIDLYPIRTDGAGGDQFSGASKFSFVIETAIDITPEINFIGSPTSGIAPLTVTFTDLSTVNPINWTWDFGDGSDFVFDTNPTHIYENPGLYKVTLWIENSTSNGAITKWNYIHAFNGATRDADTSVPGLTINNCQGPQTITINKSILTAELTSGNSVLKINPPPGSGFKNIVFSGHFTSDGNNLITGNPTGVYLVSEDIAPTSGFSSEIGANASFYYSIDLPSYPCNAILSTKIMEGVTPYYDNKFQELASNINDTSVGTAYTATITKTNFPSGTPAKIYMSVNSSWNPSIFGDWVVIWRIPDNGINGQILNTHYLFTANNLDYYEADSPLGLSTFGVSSLTGTNNPFQMIAFVAGQVVNSGGSGGGTSGSTAGQRAIEFESGVPAAQNGQIAQVPKDSATPAPLTRPAMSTNVGMIGWLLAIIQDYPIILVGVAGVIAVAAYFGWWKRRL